MPRYVTGPGCCGSEVRPDVPVVFVGRLTRTEAWLLAFLSGSIRPEHLNGRAARERSRPGHPDTGGSE